MNSFGIRHRIKNKVFQCFQEVKRFRTVLVILLLVLGAWLLYQIKPWNNLPTIARYLEEVGFWGPILYIGLVSLAFILPPAPDLILVAVSGSIFGSVMGTLYSLSGALLGATGSFYLARWLGRPLLQRQVSGQRLVLVDDFVGRLGFGLLFATRLVPGFNFSLISLAAGLTQISIVGFLAATLLGTLPQFILMTIWGQSLRGNPVILLAGVLVITLVSFMAHAAWKRHQAGKSRKAK